MWLATTVGSWGCFPLGIQAGSTTWNVPLNYPFQGWKAEAFTHRFLSSRSQEFLWDWKLFCTSTLGLLYSKQTLKNALKQKMEGACCRGTVHVHRMGTWAAVRSEVGWETGHQVCSLNYCSNLSMPSPLPPWTIDLHLRESRNCSKAKNRKLWSHLNYAGV